MEREILSQTCTGSGCGTHHYDVKYKGEWEAWALINCCDIHKYKPTDEEYEKYNKDCKMNWGGNVKVIYSDKETGITRAEVDVYYD